MYRYGKAGRSSGISVNILHGIQYFEICTEKSVQELMSFGK